jgi:hypothetical protein
MASTVQRQFPSAVTEIYQDAFVGSSMENGTTVIQFDLRQHDCHQEWGTQATLWWRQEASHVDVPELSTFHHPRTYRFSIAPGAYGNAQAQRMYCTPTIQGVSTSQPMSHSVMRVACDLAVVCGGSLRHMALLFSGLCLRPMTQAALKRGMDDIGAHLPTPEEMRQPRLALTPAPECHIDGYYPLGTDHCVMVVKDEHDRILLTHEAASEHGDDARQFRQQIKDRGLHSTAAFSDDSHRFTEASKAVDPHARFQADHCHTVKHIWGHLKKALLSYRRKGKASGAENHDEHLMALAKQLWTLRWVLLKKPTTFSREEKQTIAALEREDEGFVHRFRSIIRPLVHIFDHAHSEAQAKCTLKRLRQEITAVDDDHLQKMLPFFDDPWEQALRYLRKKGIGKHRRGSNSESGRRLLRRLEKNHDGIRSAATRQHSMQIYQAIKSLSLDMAQFIEQGPQLTGPPHVEKVGHTLKNALCKRWDTLGQTPCCLAVLPLYTQN